jgi:hypothetical protein
VLSTEALARPHRSKAEEQKAHYGPDAKLGWGKAALGGVQVICVPGDHMSLLERLEVFELANNCAHAWTPSNWKVPRKLRVPK